MRREDAKKDRRTYIRMDRIDNGGREDIENSYPYGVAIDTRSEEEIFLERPQASIVGAHNDQFLPSWIGVRYNESVRKLDRVISSIFKSAKFIGNKRELETFLLPDVAVAKIN